MKMNDRTIFNQLGGKTQNYLINSINKKLNQNNVKPIDSSFKYLGHLLQESKEYHTTLKRILYNCYDYAKTLKNPFAREFAYSYAMSRLYSGIPSYYIGLSENTLRGIKIKIHKIIERGI
jgi:hypothetical protein